MGLLHIEGYDYRDIPTGTMAPFSDARKTVFNRNIHEYCGTDYRRGEVGAGFRMGHYAYSWCRKTLDSEIDTVYVGFALNLRANPALHGSYAFMIYNSLDGVDEHCKIYVNENLGLSVWSGGAGWQGETSGEVLDVQGWSYVELKLYCDASGSMEIRFNGKEVYNETGIDFQDQSSLIGQVKILGVNNVDAWFDDWWIADDKFYGDCKVITVRPDSDETYSQFTPLSGSNYENVDDPTQDEDTSYNLGTAQGSKDTYGVSVGTLKGVVHGVQLTNRVRKTDGATAKVKNLVRSNSVDYNSTEEKTLSESYAILTSILDTDPGDSNPWTQAKIEAAEFGVEVTALSTTTTT
jgi:hypothetical protein